MSYDSSTDLQQIQSDILTEDTSSNTLMPYDSLDFLNKALKTDQTNIVGSVNDLQTLVNGLFDNFTNFGRKFNGVLLDTDSSVGQAKVQEMQTLLGFSTVLEAIVELAKRSNDSTIDTHITGLGGVLIGQVVFITNANTVAVADCNNVVCSNKVVGLAINTSSEGEKSYVRNKGKIVNPLWKTNFVTGDIAYCGNTGEITKTPNMLLSKFIQKIGVFTNDDGELLIDIAESVELE